ncbi:MAG: thermonuclease family protein [Planctomycetota bacterium]|nr:thermonuclease family protein [Planctomycetota bacterium]
MSRWISHTLALLAGAALGALGQAAYDRGAEPAAETQAAQAPQRLELSLADEGLYAVRRVVDGDTLVLENGLHVRYQGVNTPELGRFIRVAAPLAEEAKARNEELLKDKRVRLRLGPEPLDAYGRVIARVRAVGAEGEETDLESVLLEEGLGRAFGLGVPPAEYEALKAAQERAKEAGRGLWGLPHPLEQGNPRGFKFCATINGDVYHAVDAPVAKKIAAANFIGFHSREEAEASGRRPAKNEK